MAQSRTLPKNLPAAALVEVILATVVISIITVAVGSALVTGASSNYKLANNRKAYDLASESFIALEALKLSEFSNLEPGTYGLSDADGVWSLVPNVDTVGLFTRQITLTQNAPEIVKADLVISWQDRAAQNQSINLSKVFTDWQRSVTLGVSWSTPLIGASLDLNGNQDVFSILLDNKRILVGRQNSGQDFVSVNIQNPDNLTINTDLNVAGDILDISLNSNNYAFLASTSNNSELQIINVSNPTSFSNLGTLNFSGNQDANAVEIINDTFVAIGRANHNSQPEFFIVNVEVPTVPVNVLTSQIEIGGSILDMIKVGNYAFLATNNPSAELRIIDISNPLLAFTANTIDLPGNLAVTNIENKNNFLYLTTSGGELLKYDITNLTTPSLLYSINLGSSIRDISLGNDVVFIASSDTSKDFQVVSDSGLGFSLLGNLNTPTLLNSLVYDSTTDVVFAGTEGNTEEVIVIKPGS